MAKQPHGNDSLTEVERNTRDLAASLNEKDRRRLVALLAKQYGHGGIGWIANVVGCSRHTVENGMKELDLLADDPAAGRVRRVGAGRKKKINPTRKPKQT